MVEDGSGNVKIASSNAKREFAPEEISAQVLRKLTEDAAKFLNDTARAQTSTLPLSHNLNKCLANDCEQHATALFWRGKPQHAGCCTERGCDHLVMQSDMVGKHLHRP